jgi:hypothetical protein
MRAGDVFRFIGIADIHVWMVISDPRRDPSRVLIVNFSTWEPHLDQACILDAGEHPFIVHRTVINFARARTATDANLQLIHAAGRLEFLDPLSAELLKKIREATMLSTSLPLELADILLDQELID